MKCDLNAINQLKPTTDDEDIHRVKLSNVGSSFCYPTHQGREDDKIKPRNRGQYHLNQGSIRRI